MKYEIDKRDWPEKLADTIRLAKNGDTIVFPSQSMMELGERMCHGKTLVFELAEN